eukprot:PITA_36230
MDIGRRGRGRGARRMVDEALREELRVLTTRLEAVEAGRRRDPELGDVSEEEVEVAADRPEGDSLEVKLLKFVLLSNSRPKPKLPTYDGSLSIDVVLDWISEMDKYFECEEVSEDRRVKFAATKLKGHATLWWDSVQNERKRLNKPPIKTWTRMVAKLKGRFLPRDYQIALHRQVQNLRQRGLTVKEYTEEFYQVNLRAGYTEDTTERTARYVNGLRMDILDEISILSPNNTEEAYQSAIKAEEKLNRRQNARRGRGSTRGRGQSYGRGRTASNIQGLREQQKREMEREVADRFSAAEEMAVEGELVISVIDATSGGTARLSAQKQIQLDNETQRKALFRTVCKSQGKCCKMIIDNGSTDNLVSTEMVEKLGLKHLKHRNPYRVSWLQKGHQLLVDEHSEVEFQIGWYKDKIICDIMPMDVCHILLGRPWQYDRKVTHDGVLNCYKFEKDGVENSEINYAVVKKTRTVLLHTEITDLPIEIQQMLEEFTDIVVDDLLDKLCPKRSISHHINFIPGASLPNKAAYRMSPKDNEEIRKQVQ